MTVDGLKLFVEKKTASNITSALKICTKTVFQQGVNTSTFYQLAQTHGVTLTYPVEDLDACLELSTRAVRASADGAVKRLELFFTGFLAVPVTAQLLQNHRSNVTCIV